MNAYDQTTNSVNGGLIHMAIDHAVATVTLSHPAKRNALSHRMLDALSVACTRCEHEQVRSMILKAYVQAGIWSAGHDLEELPYDGPDPLDIGTPLERAIDTLRRSSFPVIAMVQGSVWGGATELVACCDIVVADESAGFAITPARIGLPYNLVGLRHFSERLSFGTIKKLFFTASPMDAFEAARTGLIDELVSGETIDQRVLAIAERIAKNAPLAIATVKQQLRALSDNRDVSNNMIWEIAELRRRAYQGRDYREGIQSFKEKRQPVFTQTTCAASQ